MKAAKTLRASWSSYTNAFVLTTLYAVSDECHQAFVASRNGNIGDVGVDALGAMLVLFLIRRLSKNDH